MVSFVRDEHYRVLDPAHPNGYKYELLGGVHHVLGNFSPCTEAKLGPWVRLNDNYMYLRQGYMWNGPDVVPDYDTLMFPSLIHDAGYQLCAHGLVPREIWKKHFDAEFARLARRQGRNPALVAMEWLAVSWFGGAAGRYKPARSL